MGRFSESIRRVPKVKNHRAARSAKAEIRSCVLNAVGQSAHVFDAFAGRGEMWRAVWCGASGYVGCDREWVADERLAYVADNRRVLRAIDLSPFSIFDLDAYGSPWEQAIIIAERRKIGPGERIGLVLTDGSALKLKQGGIPNALAEIAGLHGKLSGLARWQDDVIERALNGFIARSGTTIESRWQANGKTAASVKYIGLVLRGA